MSFIKLETRIHAPIERVFDLARSIDLHAQSTSKTGERAVAGRTSGLIGLGEEVTWRARHFGIWQELTVRVTEFERPAHFADVMIRGVFRRMEHHHYFLPAHDGTIMRDVFSFDSPLGLVGRFVDKLFLEGYMRRFIAERNHALKAAAEGEGWRKFLPTV